MGHRIFILIFILFLSFSVASYSEPTTDTVSTETPAKSDDRYEITPQLSVIQFSKLDLNNPGFLVDYMSTIEGLPAFQIRLGRTIADWRNFSFGIHGALGYGARTGKFAVTPVSSETPAVDRVARTNEITLRWIPMMLSTQVSYRIPGFEFMRPSLTLGVGNVTLMQRSPLRALDRTVGIPLVYFSPQLSFVDLADFHWLGGFTFGATFLYGIGSDSRMSASSIDLSLNLLL